MSTLLFITSAYPYYPGEQFIETEIRFLAKGFEEIYVLPLSGDLNPPHRPLPRNVALIDDIRFFREQNKRNFFSRAVGLYRAFGAIIKEIILRNSFFIEQPKAIFTLLRAASGAGQCSSLVSRVISEKRPDLIYSYWLSAGTLAAVMALDKIRSEIPVVSRIHRFDLYEEAQKPPYCPFQAFLISRLKVVIPIASDGETYLRRKYPALISNNLKTFRLGVLPNRKSTRSSNEALHLVSCSSLTKVKRIKLLIEALGFIDFPILWTHIGDGPLRDDLQGQAQALEAKKGNIKVTFLGQISNQEVLSFYENNPVDVFINVSSSEGIPVSIMEAMSRGIPTIATAVGGTPEIVDEALGAGFLLPQDVTPEQVAQKISNFHRLPKREKEEMREKTYLKWLTTFNAEKNYKDFTDFLEELSRQR